MSSNSVCNQTRDKQIGLPLHHRPMLSLAWSQTNWTPLSPITITYHGLFVSDLCELIRKYEDWLTTASEFTPIQMYVGGSQLMQLLARAL